MTDNAFESPVTEASEAVALAEPISPAGWQPKPRPPRVWTVFVAAIVALASVIGAQVVLVVAYVAWMGAQGADLRQLDPEELTRKFTTPFAFVFLGLATQAIVAAAALIPAKLSPTPLVKRLSMRRHSPLWTFVVFAVGSLPVLALGIVIVTPLARLLPSTGAGELYGQMTWAAAIPFWVFVTFAPALAEEMFFRGYVQSRLLERWPPVAAIGVASAMFAAFHLAPLQVIAVFPLGVWFGVIAWRTGSIWPGVVCHATVNGAWNIWHIGQRLAGWGDPPMWLTVVMAAIGLACFGLGVWVLVRGRPMDDDSRLPVINVI